MRSLEKAYLFEPFPVALFLNAMQEENLETLEKLVVYVFEKMGGFNINGWQLRTKTEV